MVGRVCGWDDAVMDAGTVRVTVAVCRSRHRRINLTAVPGRQVLTAACMSVRTPGFELHAAVVILVSNKRHETGFVREFWYCNRQFPT